MSDGVEITGVAETTAQTGVEMEALTAVCVAALTVYDMAKAIDTGMSVTDVALVEKTKEPTVKAAVVTVSDGVSAGEREDESGALLVELLEAESYEVEHRVVPDERPQIAAALRELALTVGRHPDDGRHGRVAARFHARGDRVGAGPTSARDRRGAARGRDPARRPMGCSAAASQASGDRR